MGDESDVEAQYGRSAARPSPNDNLGAGYVPRFVPREQTDHLCFSLSAPYQDLFDELDPARCLYAERMSHWLSYPSEAEADGSLPFSKWGDAPIQPGLLIVLVECTSKVSSRRSP